MSRDARGPWLASPGYDLGLFVFPGLVSALAAAIWVGLGDASERGDLSLWIVGVLLVDVAHVYASLYRTYLDPEARRLHGGRLWWTPALVLWFGFLLHLESPRLFWSVLAYIAVFHFIKQHLGFALLYVKAGREARRDDKLVRMTLWTCTLAPVVYWHSRLPREFEWFTAHDFVGGVPELVGSLAVWAQLPVLLIFVGRRFTLARSGQINLMVPLLVLTPALTWNMGIVWFNDDRVFTLTNVFLHGVPYLALVWLTGGRQRSSSWLPTGWRERGALAAGVFYLALVVLAVLEEGLWDQLVWHEHQILFGEWNIRLEGWPVALVSAILTVPQATHYIIDRWIWRPGPDNPRLATQLKLGPPPPSQAAT